MNESKHRTLSLFDLVQRHVVLFQHGLRLEPRPSPSKKSSDGADPAPMKERERERELLFERETEHLWLRQLMHGIGGGPRSPARETATPLTS